MKSDTRTVYLVLRNGELKMRLPNATVGSDGIVSVNGAFVVDGELAKADGCYETVAGAAKNRLWTSINRKYLGRLGTSSSGLEIVAEDDYDARRRAASAAHLAAHPEIRERQAITALYEEAERIRYEDTDRYFNLRRRADARLATWRATYPGAAAEEEAAQLRDKAEHARSMAAGALVYDADGSLSQGYQERSHDEWEARAEELETQAAELLRQAAAEQGA